jgi:hypothetical protein
MSKLSTSSNKNKHRAMSLITGAIVTVPDPDPKVLKRLGIGRKLIGGKLVRNSVTVKIDSAATSDKKKVKKHQ